MKAKSVASTFFTLTLILNIATLGIAFIREAESSSPETTIFIAPETIVNMTKTAGTNFTVRINVTYVELLRAWDIKIRFNPVLLYTNETLIEEGSFLKSGGDTSFQKPYFESDYVQIACLIKGYGGADGEGDLASVTFIVKGSGETWLDVYDTELKDIDNVAIEHVSKDGYFRNVGSELIPVASFTYSPTDPKWTENVAFNASASHDDNTVARYLWFFGDKNTTTSEERTANVTDPIIFHCYYHTVVPDEYNYTVRLIVIDNENITGNLALKVITVRAGPLASFTYSPITPIVNKTVTFNASESKPDRDTEIVDYAWDFGDGNITSVTSSIITHAYADAGTYDVNLTVTDDKGRIDSATKTILVTIVVASFAFTPTAPFVDETVMFNASDSKSVGGTIVSYSWDFGDGNITAVTNPIINHTYTIAETYTVTLNVTDTQGQWSVESKSITVRSPPVANFTYSPEFPFADEKVTFDASGSEPDGGTITSYFWAFDDGNTASVADPIITHTYAAAGNYTVTLTINDTDQLADSFSKDITVKKLTSTITISASPTTITVGSSLVINGSISSIRQGVNVTILYKLSGEDIWNTLANTTTNAEGRYSYTWLLLEPGTYEIKAVWGGDEKYSGAESDIIFVVVTKVSTTISMSVPLTSIVLGETLTINGTISPAPGEVNATILYRLGEGSWAILHNVTTDKDGFYSYDWEPTTAGTYQIKTVWEGNERYEGSESEEVTILVQEAVKGLSNLLYFAAFSALGTIVAVVLFVYMRTRHRSK